MGLCVFMTTGEFSKVTTSPHKPNRHGLNMQLPTQFSLLSKTNLIRTVSWGVKPRTSDKLHGVTSHKMVFCIVTAVKTLRFNENLIKNAYTRLTRQTGKAKKLPISKGDAILFLPASSTDKCSLFYFILFSKCFFANLLCLIGLDVHCL